MIWRICGFNKSNLDQIMKKWIVRQWSGRPGFNLSHTKDSKMVLDATLLNTQYYKESIKGKVEQSKKWSSALPNT